MRLGRLDFLLGQIYYEVLIKNESHLLKAKLERPLSLLNGLSHMNKTQ